MILDLIILGAGPAGITAAVYAARKRLNFMIISKDIGGQAAWAGRIENYTGYQFIAGPDLVSKFMEHLKQYSFPLIEGEEARKVIKQDGHFKVLTERGEYEAKAVIVATGKKPRPLNVPGEEEFRGRGVTYCATCDGPLFAGKDVAVVGGGNSALDATLSLAKIAQKVYLVNINRELAGDAVMIGKVLATPNVSVLNQAKTLEITGDQFVSGLKLEQKGKTETLAVKGIFIEVGLIPNSGLIDFVEKNESGEILINCASETSQAGIFAAGDVTDVPDKQIVIAAGEGAKAALRAFRYLAELK